MLKTVNQILIAGSNCVTVFLQCLSEFLIMSIVAVQEGSIMCSTSQFAKFICLQEHPPTPPGNTSLKVLKEGSTER